jgi:hypothetical protein
MTLNVPVRGLTIRWAARAAVLIAGVAAVAALLPGPADAHPLSTTAVLLDLGPDTVTGQVQLPIGRLALAVEQPTVTTAAAQQPAKIEEVRRYLLEHTSATDPQTAAPWQVSADGGRVETIDGVDHLVYDLTLAPPGGTVGDFRLDYDAILHQLLSHRIFVSVRGGGAADYTVVGVLDWQQHTVDVPAAGAGARAGFVAAVRLGVTHIAEGADHLLFLIMLLIPAPLLALRRHWVRTDDFRRNCRRIVHVVTAFALGHSITLALAALGYVSVPTRVVESLIAASILVSGLHAIRPLIPGGEAWIAAGFGLMHGLSFAALLGELDLGRGSLVVDLLGFNLGIELTQLMVVALLMPSLIVLSRTRVYPIVRRTLAGAGVVMAAAWLAERTTLITTNPLNTVTDVLVAHPFSVAGVLALTAATVWAVPTMRTTTAPTAPTSAKVPSPI